MTRDDAAKIIRSVAPPEFADGLVDEDALNEIMPLLLAVAAAEREACAEIARKAIPKEKQFDFQITAGNTARLIEQIIRARGGK